MVPMLGGDAVAPLIALIPLAFSEFDSLVRLWRDLLFFGCWQLGVWLVWLIVLRSRMWFRFLIAPAAALLTLGPLYWHLLNPPPTVEEIVRLRPAEKGDWPEVCRFEDYRMAETGKGELWLSPFQYEYESRPYLLVDVSTCGLTFLKHVPPKAGLVDFAAGGEALWMRSGYLFSSRTEHPRPILVARDEGLSSNLIRFSEDGSRAAWIAKALPPLAYGWTLHVRTLSGAETLEIPLQTPGEVDRLSRLLAYDPASGRASVSTWDGRLMVFDRYGKLVFGPFQPDGCDGHGASFFVRAGGWGYRGLFVPECRFRWDLAAGSGWYDVERYSGALNAGRIHLSSIDVNEVGTLAAVATKVVMGPHTSAPESVSVFRISDGEELFRQHFLVEPDFSFLSPRVRFFDAGWLAYAHAGRVSVIRVPEVETRGRSGQ